MKRFIILAISLLFMVSAANAQLSKGDLLVGGAVCLSLDISGGNDIFGGGTDADVSFALEPSLLYMLSDNWYFGGSLGLGVSPTVNGESATVFSLGPEGGYYVPFNKTLGLFNSIRMDFGVMEKDFFFGFNFIPKLAVALSDKFILTSSLASLGYNSGSETFSINLLDMATIGFYYTF